jgi:hypothetical protein
MANPNCPKCHGLGICSSCLGSGSVRMSDPSFSEAPTVDIPALGFRQRSTCVDSEPRFTKKRKAIRDKKERLF